MEWKFSYSRWTGIWFGPIPVGIILGVVVVIGWALFKAMN